MVARGNSSMGLYRILLLSFAQDAHHGAGKGSGCGQEVEATDRSGGDFDAPSGRQKARSSRHGHVSREWRRRWHDGPWATRRGSAVTGRRRPVRASERHRKLQMGAPCGRSLTSPYEGRKRGSRSAAESVGQSRWPILIAAVACHGSLCDLATPGRWAIPEVGDPRAYRRTVTATASAFCPKRPSELQSTSERLFQELVG